jgi:8-oxo-dGTP diphosphatase
MSSPPAPDNAVPPATPSPSSAPPPLPYRIACLCDLRDRDNRILLLRRSRSPNLGLCSPIGGKLDMASGESPAQCARREIQEEAGIDVPIDRLHLIGLVSECAFEGRGHWLMFVYRVLGPVEVPPRTINEGELNWYTWEEVQRLPLPETDREVIWPLLHRYEPHTAEGGGEGRGGGQGREGGRPGFFAVHIDCRPQAHGGQMISHVEQFSR